MLAQCFLSHSITYTVASPLLQWSQDNQATGPAPHPNSRARLWHAKCQVASRRSAAANSRFACCEHDFDYCKTTAKRKSKREQENRILCDVRDNDRDIRLTESCHHRYANENHLQEIRWTNDVRRNDKQFSSLLPACDHKTRLAMRTTFMNRFSRSSRATAPVTRVPMGPERSRFISTAAFS